nr:hypothetical protein [Allomuricauda sp.]
MKSVGLFMVFLCCGWAIPGLAQLDANTQTLRFYEQLAQRDADYEIELYKLGGQDELDYWADQADFERQLGKANFPGYLAYMKGKKEAYELHLEACSTQCANSELFFQKARDYLSLSDDEFMESIKTDVMVQHFPKQKKIK